MLPTINLQASELLTFDTAQGAGSLVPEGADSLEAGFADILHQGRYNGLASGEDLPADGKELPLLAVSDEFVANELDSELLNVGLPGAAQAERLASAAIPTLQPTEAGDPTVTELDVPGLQLAADLRQTTPALNGPQSGIDLQTAEGKGWQPPVMLPPAAPRVSTGAESLTPAVSTDTADIAHDGTLASMRAIDARDLMLEPGGDRARPGLAAAQSSPTGAELRVADSAASLQGTGSQRPAANPDTALLMPLEEVPVKPAATNVAQTLPPIADPSLIGPAAGRFTVDMPASAVQQAVSQAVQLPVQEAGWDQAIAERVVMMANGKLQNAEIRLTPADLGPLRIQLSLDDGAAHVTFQAQHAVTRDAIEQAMPRLREMLAEQGLSLGQASVSEEGSRQGVREEASDARTAAVANADGELDGDEVEAPVTRQRVSNGLLDTFA